MGITTRCQGAGIRGDGGVALDISLALALIKAWEGNLESVPVAAATALQY